MPAIAWIAMLAAGVGLFFFSRKASAAGASDTTTDTTMETTDTAISQDDSGTGLDALFQKWGAYYEVDWRLIKAHAIVESALNPNAENKADPSVGLMQILCKPDGGGGCSNVFHVEGWSKATHDGLFDPDFNIQIGTQIIQKNIAAYGLPRAIAVYNRYAERNSPQEGPFQNQAYVDKVISHYKELTK